MDLLLCVSANDSLGLADEVGLAGDCGAEILVSTAVEYLEGVTSGFAADLLDRT